MCLNQQHAHPHLGIGLEGEVAGVLESLGGIRVANSRTSAIWLLCTVATLDLCSLGGLSSRRSGRSSSIGVVGEVSLARDSNWSSSNGRSRCGVDGSNVNLLGGDKTSKDCDEGECVHHVVIELVQKLNAEYEGVAVLVLDPLTSRMDHIYP